MRISTICRSAKRLIACDAPSSPLQSKWAPATVCTWRSVWPAARAAARMASQASCASSGSSPHTVYRGFSPFSVAWRRWPPSWSARSCIGSPASEFDGREAPHHLQRDVVLHRAEEQLLFLFLRERVLFVVRHVAALQQLGARDQLAAERGHHAEGEPRA